MSQPNNELRRILVIDDDDLTCRWLGEMLSNAGFDVHSTCDGESGVRLFCAERFDLVITDLVMPDKNGVEVVRDILEHRPDARVIAISGGEEEISSSVRLLNAAKSMGAVGALQKPFQSSQIVEMVREVLS